MGYTHYWTFKKPAKGTTEAVEKRYKRAVKDCQKIVKHFERLYGGLSGYSAHTKLGQYGGLRVNGKGSQAHEDFILREHYNQNEGFQFCKTAQKRYDEAVTACLILMKRRMGDLMSLDSDGDETDWDFGAMLVKDVMGYKTTPVVEFDKE